MIEDMAADIASGHNIVATVYVDCRSMYRANGPEAFRPVGEVELQRGRGDERQRAVMGPARINAGIVSHVNLLPATGQTGAGSEIVAATAVSRHPAFSAWGRRACVAACMRRGQKACCSTEFSQGLCLPCAVGLSFDAWLFQPADR